MLSPTVLAFFAGLSVFLILMGVLRPAGTVFSARSSDEFLQGLDIKLKQAGIVSISPPVLIIGTLIGAALVGFVIFFATGSPIAAVIFGSLTPVFVNFDIDRRARSFQDKLTQRLVAFLRKIESLVRAGENPAKAFAIAAHEDKLLSWVLRDPLRDLELQRNFNDVLESTIPLVPIRPWIQFIRSMQAFSESGGRLAETLSANISRINSQVLLRQRLMGDVAQYRSQQFIILGFAVAIPVLLTIAGSGTFGSVFDSGGGIFMFCIAVGLDVLALWITKRAIADVERRLDA